MNPEQVPAVLAEKLAKRRYDVVRLTDKYPENWLGWEKLIEQGPPISTEYRDMFLNGARADLAAVLPEWGALVLEALADERDREVAEAVAKSDLADVRCIDCNLRYEERDEYGCEGRRGHTYSETDIEIAQRVDVVATYGSNEIRKRAAEYREGKRP